MQRHAIAIIDDYQDNAMQLADWSGIQDKADIQVFNCAWENEDDLIRKLQPFSIISLMRERTAFPARVIERLPNLKLISMTGGRTSTLDIDACTRRGIWVSYTGSSPSHAAAELALGLMFACARAVPRADENMRGGKWQQGIPMGMQLEGRRLGVVGLGKLGAYVARVGLAMGMEVVAWSQNLTAQAAQEQGVQRVEKNELFATSDVVSLHLTLSQRSLGIVGRPELESMKEGAIFINTSRGPLVDEGALLDVLGAGRIIAGLDVYDTEPLPAHHPLRTMPNVVLAPHLGYVVSNALTLFLRESARNIETFLAGEVPPLRNPEVLNQSGATKA
ncbi:D-2-hydroxyacid dehydrogenase family protein [Allopusillimonas soli]|uniref:D-2-hydroxyacid dehydrogenase family protein n=1 Tax=Allopusillimonas soli TaxID=659016 RepID=A0A853FBL1_9BURK|nr:D-2-hydroxyacid dehydrogenase family protein [Allopusillimonas soli]NYT35931.1 D-2-hydroxyacid dehydrogenase family protein [Allopusillimonas soli]TEA76286.1 D-2-hydroxyacid dehydrogenase family protein [Allopusillimonas soli]